MHDDELRNEDIGVGTLRWQCMAIPKACMMHSLIMEEML